MIYDMIYDMILCYIRYEFDMLIIRYDIAISTRLSYLHMIVLSSR